jgi:hypothetical protein
MADTIDTAVDHQRNLVVAVAEPDSDLGDIHLHSLPGPRVRKERSKENAKRSDDNVANAAGSDFVGLWEGDGRVAAEGSMS